jgi:dihydroneopterin aldolase
MTKICIYQVEFDAHVGVTEEERATPQKISSDLELTGVINTAADDLNETIDYDAVCRKMMAICQTPVCLIETFAEKIVQMALENTRVRSVRVRVKKDHPSLKEIRGGFVVEIERGRSDCKSDADKRESQSYD